MTKAYLVSEELLRQVLDSLEIRSNGDRYLGINEHAAYAELRAILAKEPNGPVAVITNAGTLKLINIGALDYGTELFVKDAP